MIGNDIMLAFPGFLLALALVAARGSSLENVILAVAIAYTPRVAAVMRSVVLTGEVVELGARRRLPDAERKPTAS